MNNILLFTIIAIIIGEYVLSMWIKNRNIKASTQPIPTELSDIYDADTYEKQQKYFNSNTRFGTIISTFSTFLIIALLSAQVCGWFYNQLLSITTNTVLLSFLFMTTLIFFNTLIMLPFSIYDTFVIEEKFGFNKTTPKTFAFDIIKSIILNTLITGIVLSLITLSYVLLGTNFWKITFLIIMLFSIVMTFFYSNIIIPFFNKQTPLPEGELRNAIEDFAKKVNFKLDNIYVIDGSKRSTKANAYFTGFGKKKRVVLYDTLITDLTIDEIVAVLAHEIGHYKKHHIIRGFIRSSIVTLFKLFLLSCIIESPAITRCMGVEYPAFIIALFVFGILYTPISIIIGLVKNYISRFHEYQADSFAAKYDMGEYLISALKKISAKSLSNLTPDKLFVIFNYSHPTLLDRIKNIQKHTNN